MGVEVTTGQVHALAQTLATKMGIRIRVFRDDQPPKTMAGGHKIPGSIRYSLVLQDVPQIFANMTINECKSRLAMILDLIHSGVFTNVRKSDQAVQAKPDERQNSLNGGEVGGDESGDGDVY